MKKIAMIVGARPNFMKAYPIYMTLKEDFEITLIHTGQHFDAKMSDVFFNQLNFPKPDIHFELTEKTRAGDIDHKLYVNNKEYLQDKKKVIEELKISTNIGQLGEIRDNLIIEFKKLQPDLIIVFGDVTSTLAGALAGLSLNIEVVHIESGLRSFDLEMPEEVNRILTDSIVNYLFVTEQSGVDNLKKEGIINNVYLVGNTMIDCLMMFKDRALETKYHEVLGAKEKEYVLITLHRPSNVDNLDKLKEIINDIAKLSNTEKIIFPVHPRTKKNIEKLGISLGENIILCEPLGYLEFTCLEANAKYVITDSGGIQEETTALGVPCFTLRENTERPSTLIENGGTNILVKKIEEIKLKKFKTQNNTYNNCMRLKMMKLKLSEFLNKKKLYENSYKFETVYLKKNDHMKEGDFHYKYDDVDYLYKNKNKENLLVLFHGSRKSNGDDIIFRGYNYDFEDFDVISFSDPNFKKYKNLELGWFLSEKSKTFNTITHIIKNIKNKYSKIVFFGSSGGGFISLLLSGFFHEYAFITNSQIYLEKYYYYKKFKEITKYSDDIDIDNFLEKNKPKHIYIYQNINDNIHYTEHFFSFLKKWEKKINITPIQFERNDLKTQQEHHGIGQFPIETNFQNEIKLHFRKNILIIQNNILIGGAQLYGMNIAKVLNKYNITFLLNSKETDSEKKKLITHVGCDVDIIYDILEIKNKFWDYIFVNSYPMEFVDNLKKYFINLKMHCDKIYPIIHNETNRFTISISQINNPKIYFTSLICVFERLGNKFINNFISKNNCDVICVYPSYDDIIVNNANKKNDKKEKNIICFYGRILPSKGVFLLIKYWKILHKDYPNWKLKITGNYAQYSKKYYDDIITYVHENKLNDVIEFDTRDIITQEEKNKVFQDIDIFVQLSLYEGFPFTILEALSNKVPVLHTNVGGVNEILSEDMGELLNFDGVKFENFDFIDYEKIISHNLYEKFFNKNYEIFKTSFEKIINKKYDFKKFEKNIKKYNFKNFEKKIFEIIS